MLKYRLTYMVMQKRVCLEESISVGAIHSTEALSASNVDRTYA